MKSPLLKRYCKECGNVTHVQKDNTLKVITYQSIITILLAMVMAFGVELLSR